MTHRGHFMCMHAKNVEIRYASFNDLGRTNKRLYPDGMGFNTKGRYAVHFHICGNDPAGPIDPANSTPWLEGKDGGPHFPYRKQIVCRGVSVMNSPGWGFSNHASNVGFEDCVSFNCRGAGFVEESGNGIGHFTHCLSIRNGMNRKNPRIGDWREHLGEDTTDGRPRVIDVAVNGHGFFYRGNLMETKNCVAVSCDHSGFAWNAKHSTGGSRISAQSLPFPATANGKEFLKWADTPIALTKDCVVAASAAGFYHWYSGPTGEGRTVLENAVGWNLVVEGLYVNYGNFGSQVTVNGAVLIADQLPNSFKTENVWHKGLITSNTIHNVVYNNCYVRGFKKGISVTNNGFVEDIYLTDNCQFFDYDTKIHDPDHVLRQITLPANHDLLTINLSSSHAWTGLLGNGFKLHAVKTDPIGVIDTKNQDYSYAPRINTDNPWIFDGDALKELLGKGYFRDTMGNYMVLPYAICNRLDGRTETYYYKHYITDSQLASYRNETPVGPNLGVFIAPNTTTVPVPNPTVLPGSYSTAQSVSFVSPLTGCIFYYTTDGSTPVVDAALQPVGSTKRFNENGPISIGPGTTTLKAVAYAGLMTPSPCTSFLYQVPSGSTTGSASSGTTTASTERP